MSAPDLTVIEEALHAVTGVADLLDQAHGSKLQPPLTEAAICLLCCTLEDAVKAIKAEIWPEQGGAS